MMPFKVFYILWMMIYRKMEKQLEQYTLLLTNSAIGSKTKGNFFVV
jgi:hypothetical protein